MLARSLYLGLQICSSELMHAASGPKSTGLFKAAVLMCEKAKHERMTEDSRDTCASCMGHHKIR